MFRPYDGPVGNKAFLRLPRVNPPLRGVYLAPHMGWLEKPLRGGSLGGGSEKTDFPRVRRMTAAQNEGRRDGENRDFPMVRRIAVAGK